MPLSPELAHELLQTLANVKGISWVKWDSLGQAIVVAVVVGPDDGHTSAPFPVHMKPEVATELLRGLQQALSERADEGWTRQ
jgi:hypothetical protein